MPVLQRRKSDSDLIKTSKKKQRIDIVTSSRSQDQQRRDRAKTIDDSSIGLERERDDVTTVEIDTTSEPRRRRHDSGGSGSRKIPDAMEQSRESRTVDDLASTSREDHTVISQDHTVSTPDTSSAHEFGKQNVKHGVCGFTSALYAVSQNQLQMQESLSSAAKNPRSRLMVEIKTFMERLKRDETMKRHLGDIEELTQSFQGFEHWTVDNYIQTLDKSLRSDDTKYDYSVAMPPLALMEYLTTEWDFKPKLEQAASGQVLEKFPSRQGNAILGLTLKGDAGPQNRFGNLAHYVYQREDGKLFSWGEEFDSLEDIKKRMHYDFAVVSRITLDE